MEPRSPSKTKVPIMGFIQNVRLLRITPIIVVLVIMILVSLGVYLMVRVRPNRFVPKTSSYFTVVLDCGSSGTRVNVYEFLIKEVTNSTWDLPVLVHSYPHQNSTMGNHCHYHCLQTVPGLDRFVGNASGVRESIEPLIVRAETWVPREKRRETPIFVLGTAGLRALPEGDSGLVLGDVLAVVKEHEFMHRESWIRVLSGKEEAYYAWVALNYRMGVFQNSSRVPALGLLDLGGSSLQVVTEISEPSSGEDEVLRSKIGLFEHRVLAYSLPAFGLNEAFDRTVVMLSHTEALRENIVVGRFEIGHPCLSSGFIQNYTCRGCFGVNVTDAETSAVGMGENDVTRISLVGEPNWEKCKVLARDAAVNSSNPDWSRLFSDDAPCRELSSIHLRGNSDSVARYHALSGFFAVYNSLDLNPIANLTKMWEAGQHFCSRSLSGLTGVPTSQNHAEQICFRVPYIVSLIENALCLSDREIVFGPGDVSWTLGAALIEGKELWLNSHPRPQTGILPLRFDKLFSSPLILFLLLVFLFFIVYRSQIKLLMPIRKFDSFNVSLPSYTGLKMAACLVHGLQNVVTAAF